MLMFYAVLVHVLVCWCVFYRAAQVCYVQLTRMFVCMLSACTIVADVYVVYNYREHVRSWALNKANVYCIQGVHMYIVYHVCGCVYNGMCVCVCCVQMPRMQVWTPKLWQIYPTRRAKNPPQIDT